MRWKNAYLAVIEAFNKHGAILEISSQNLVAQIRIVFNVALNKKYITKLQRTNRWAVLFALECILQKLENI